MTVLPAPFILVALLALPGAAANTAQTPLTGQMLGNPPPGAPARLPASPAPEPTARAWPDSSAATASAAPARLPPGEATRHLLRLQASGSHAGPALPMTGEQAHASHARYLKSFEHPLPPFFDGNVGRTSSAEGR